MYGTGLFCAALAAAGCLIDSPPLPAARYDGGMRGSQKQATSSVSTAVSVLAGLAVGLALAALSTLYAREYFRLGQYESAIVDTPDGGKELLWHRVFESDRQAQFFTPAAWVEQLLTGFRKRINEPDP